MFRGEGADMSGLYTRLCAEVLFPLHERIKGHDTVRVRRFLEASQWWPKERLAAYQVERLRGFLEEIGARVPYYRDLFRSIGFEPAELRSVADLQRLPRLGKAEIRAAGERMKADGAVKLNRYNTGGSSGEPLVFYTGVGPRRGCKMARDAMVGCGHRRS
jgi:phenylacetate-CoA ligase